MCAVVAQDLSLSVTYMHEQMIQIVSACTVQVVFRSSDYALAEVHEREKYAFLIITCAMCDSLAEGVISLFYV
jgi:hypothetical protein